MRATKAETALLGALLGSVVAAAFGLPWPAIAVVAAFTGAAAVGQRRARARRHPSRRSVYALHLMETDELDQPGDDAA